jgi:hypothetical protein
MSARIRNRALATARDPAGYGPRLCTGIVQHPVAQLGDGTVPLSVDPFGENNSLTGVGESPGPKVQQPVRQLSVAPPESVELRPWGNILLLLHKLRYREMRLWYYPQKRVIKRVIAQFNR